MAEACSTSTVRATTWPLRQTTLLFLVLWLPGSALDVLTTELARRQGGWLELNPSGFVPLSTAIARELILAFFVTAVVMVGAYYRRDALCRAVDSSLDQFGAALFHRKAWAVPLLGIPFIGAFVRYGVVISNACYLSIGWSPIDKVFLLPLAALFGDDTLAYVVSTTIGIIVLWYPITALIVRLLYVVNRRVKRSA